MRIPRSISKLGGHVFSEFWRRRRALVAPFDRRRLLHDLEVLQHWPAAPPGPEDLTVVSPVYNGAPHIQPFIEHHLALGARHIVLLDNGSVDATIDLARQLECVTLLRTRLTFARHSLAMRRYLTETFGSGGWVLLADIDERFDYPFSERLPLRGLLRYLNSAGFTSMAAQLLDLFPDGPLSTWPPAGQAALAASVWYEVDSLVSGPLPRAARGNRFPAGEPVFLRGGVRARALGGGGGLSKFPLLSRVKPGGPRLTSAHFVRGGRVADVDGVLRHYKFDASFRDFCLTTVERGSHFRRSASYREHLKALASNPNPVLHGPSAHRYVSAAELLPMGFLRASQGYRKFVESWSGSPA